MKKKFFTLLVPGMLILCLVSGCTAQAMEESSTKTSVKEVTRGNLLIGLSYDGKVALPVTALNFEVSGKIKNINVSPGDTVKKGDLLAELDDSDLQFALSNAQINLAKAQAAYDNAVTNADYNLQVEKANLKNLQREYNSLTDPQTTVDSAQEKLKKCEEELKNANAEQPQDQDKIDKAQKAYEDAQTALQKAKDDLENANKNYENSKASLSSSISLQKKKINNTEDSDPTLNAYYELEDAKNKLESAQNDIEKNKIFAPIDGKILDISKKVGEVVNAKEDSPTMGMGASSLDGFISLCDTSEIYLTTSITEGDIIGIAVGQEMRVTIDALGEENLTGKVYSVSSIPSTDSSGIITYEVIGKLDTLNDEIKDNMSAFISFVKMEKENVLQVPNKAIFIEDNQQYVNVQLDNGGTEKRAVSCGLSNGTQTEVISGLSVGEKVIIGGTSN